MSLNAATISATITKRQYLDMSTAARKRIGRSRGMTIVGVVFLVAVFLVTLGLLRYADWAFGRMDGAGRLSLSDTVLVAFIIGMVLGWLMVAMMSAIYAQNFIASGLREGGSFLGPRTVAFDEDGVTLSGANGTSTTRWASVMDASHFGETVLIWTDPAAAIMIPKAAIGDDDDVKAFLNEINAKVVRAA